MYQYVLFFILDSLFGRSLSRRPRLHAFFADNGSNRQKSCGTAPVVIRGICNTLSLGPTVIVIKGLFLLVLCASSRLSDGPTLRQPLRRYLGTWILSRGAGFKGLAAGAEWCGRKKILPAMGELHETIVRHPAALSFG